MTDDAMHFASRATLLKAVRLKHSATPHLYSNRRPVSAWFLGARTQIGCSVVVAHVAAISVLASSTYARRAEPVEHVLSTAFVQTNNPERVSVEPAPQLLRFTVLQDPLDPVMSLPPPPRIVLEEANAEAVSAAPRLLDEAPPDVTPYAKLGGLLPGESAVVVLRVEILPDGTTGDIQVDVTSGSDQVDQAAAAYARLLIWLPGTFHGTGQRTWIRHAVRLAA